MIDQLLDRNLKNVLYGMSYNSVGALKGCASRNGADKD
jgi:hypothetical protein